MLFHDLKLHLKITIGTKCYSDCKENEIFYECGLYSERCEQTCEDERIPPCPKVCGYVKCQCEHGFRRLEFRAECVPLAMCPNSSHLTSLEHSQATGE